MAYCACDACFHGLTTILLRTLLARKCFVCKALRRDPPALLVADRRAIAAFRACSELGLRCVVNSAGLLGDLDKPPNAIPAPFTGTVRRW